MLTPALVIAAVVVLGVLFVLVPVMSNAYYRYRGRHVVLCPENRRSAVVEIDGRRVAAASALGKTRLRIARCSRWPEHEECDRGCLGQVEEEPEATRLRALLDRWYEGKTCFLCHRPFESVEWWERPPAVMGDDGFTHDFRDLAEDAVLAMLDTGRPVCRNCHLAETFRRVCPVPVGDRHPGSDRR
ncbi:MAG: hypothetical protein ACREQ9_26810 [Candidatus Binatia bacterium]